MNEISLSKPTKIKHLSVLFDVCSMFCKECNRWKYHQLSEKIESETDIVTTTTSAICIKCEKLNYYDEDIKVKIKR